MLRFGFLLSAALLLTLASAGQSAHPSVSQHHHAKANDTQSGFFPGAINIFAGNGTANGDYANGLLPTDVSIGSPTAVTSDSAGNIFFAGNRNSGYAIFVIYEGGTVPPLLAAVTTQASTPVTPVKGNIYQVTAVSSNCGYCYTDGIPASQAFLNNIQGLSFDSTGNLYIAAGLNMYSIFKVDYDTTHLHVVAGEFDLISSYVPGDTIDGVPATSVLLSAPTDVKTDSFGNIYFTDESNVVALVVYAGSQPPPVLAAEGISTTPSDKGNIYTIAGQVQNFCSSPGTCTDAGPARGSLISGAISLAVDAAGNVYILDNYAYTVRVIYVAGTVSLLSTVQNPQSGYIYTVAGLNTQFTPCAAAPCGDGGSAADILFNAPLYLAVDAGGNVYVDDSLDHAVRKIDSAGNVSTIAGIADPKATPPAVPAGGGAATSTPLNLPTTIAFDPQDNLYIADGGYNIVWNVGPAQPQTITFPKLDSPVIYSASQIALEATASSGLPVKYSKTGPASISGSGSNVALSISGAGVVTVTALQAGNAEYASATPVKQSITVNKAQLTVSAADATKKYGQPNPSFTATYSVFVNGDTQATALTGQPAITTTATTTSNFGSYPLTVTQGTLASSNYAFTFVNGTLAITGATSQTITFTPLAAITYGQTSALALSASASSGLPVQYAVTSGPGKIAGSTLTILGGGTIVITATQTGSNVYAGATPVTQSLTVNPAPLTVTAPALSFPFGTVINTTLFPPPIITGFVGSDSASLVNGNALYTTNASGTPQGGKYTLTVAQGTLAVVPAAAANYTLSNFVPGSLTIIPTPQTISTLPLPAISYNGGPYTVTATASSGLPVTFASTGPVAFSGTNVTAPGNGINTVAFTTTGVGPATLTLTQAGTADFAAATPVVLSFNVNKAELDVQANNAIQEQGAPNPTFSYSIGANVQGFVDIPSIVSGVPVLTTTATPSSPPGSYPIVPSVGTLVSPVYYFKFINGTLTITPPGSFAITANPSSLTIPTGMSRQATITITPSNAYQGTVTLSCGQLPANVTCTVSPAIYTFPGSQNADGSENTAQGTITIVASSGTVVGALPAGGSSLRAASFFLPGALAALLLALARRRISSGNTLWSLGFFIILGLGMSSLASCGGSKGLGTTAAPGTSTVTINGSGTTPSGSGLVSASAPLTVTIQ